MGRGTTENARNAGHAPQLLTLPQEVFGEGIEGVNEKKKKRGRKGAQATQLSEKNEVTTKNQAVH